MWKKKKEINKNRQHIKLLQILEWNTTTESAHTETGDKAFQAEQFLRKKKKYLCALMVDE